QAALTGHVVFSTLHTNTAAGAIMRLTNMDVEPFLIASAVVGVVAQRLARRVCPRCAESYRPSSEILEQLGLDAEEHAAARRQRGLRHFRTHDGGFCTYRPSLQWRAPAEPADLLQPPLDVSPPRLASRPPYPSSRAQSGLDRTFATGDARLVRSWARSVSPAL